MIIIEQMVERYMVARDHDLCFFISSETRTTNKWTTWGQPLNCQDPEDTDLLFWYKED